MFIFLIATIIFCCLGLMALSFGVKISGDSKAEWIFQYRTCTEGCTSQKFQTTNAILPSGSLLTNNYGNNYFPVYYHFTI